MSPPSLALVGCGAIADAFYIPALTKRPDLLASLVVVDRNRERAEAVRARLGAQSAFTDYKDVLERVDGAIVATPHRLHAPITLEFLARGVHVLCEKPLAETAAEVDRIVATAAANNVSVCVNHTRRLFTSFQEVQRLASSGAIGEIREVDYVLGEPFGWPAETNTYFGTAAGGRGVLFDTGAHIVDLVCWFLGGEPEIVSYADDSYGGTEAVAKLSVRRGKAVARVHLSWLSKLKNQYRVVGTEGALEGRAYEWSSFTRRDSRGGAKKIRTDGAVPFTHFADKLLQNFTAVIEGRERPSVSASDVRPAVALIDACYARRTRIDEPWFQPAARATHA